MIIKITKTQKSIYILICAIYTSLTLYYYSFLLEGVIPSSNLYREFCICFGQLLFQTLLLIIFRLSRTKLLDYLQEMITVSFWGATCLLPCLLIHIFFNQIPSLIYMGYFLLVALWMLINHIKRVSIIKAPKWLSVTWVIYRLLVLAIIL